MGKLRQNDSDNEMDIEPKSNHNKIDAQNLNKVPKKNKKIIKAKLTPTNQSKSKLTKTNISKNIVNQFAKIVNLKKSQRSLTQKQQIFKNVVKGLNVQKMSKELRRKSRVQLKRQLHKALQRVQKHQAPKAALSTIESEKSSIVHKKKKEPLNEKAEVTNMRNAMGTSLSSLKSMLAQRLN